MAGHRGYEGREAGEEATAWTTKPESLSRSCVTDDLPQLKGRKDVGASRGAREPRWRVGLLAWRGKLTTGKAGGAPGAVWWFFSSYVRCEPDEASVRSLDRRAARIAFRHPRWHETSPCTRCRRAGDAVAVLEAKRLIEGPEETPVPTGGWLVSAMGREG